MTRHKASLRCQVGPLRHVSHKPASNQETCQPLTLQAVKVRHTHVDDDSTFCKKKEGTLINVVTKMQTKESNTGFFYVKKVQNKTNTIQMTQNMLQRNQPSLSWCVVCPHHIGQASI